MNKSIKKLRRFLAGLSVAAMLSTLVVVPAAHAQSFDEDFDRGTANWGIQGGAGDQINRCEAAVIWVRALGIEPEVLSPDPFTDVPSWAAPFVHALKKRGIVAGYKDASGNPTGVYGCSDQLNRAAQFVLLKNALGLPDVDVDAELKPAEKAQFAGMEWALGSLASAAKSGLVSGKGEPGADGTRNFAPTAGNTRKEAVVISVRSADQGYAPALTATKVGGSTPVVVTEDEVVVEEEEDTAVEGEVTVDLPPPPATEVAVDNGEAGTLSAVVSGKTPPAGTTIPQGATNVPLAAWDFSASGGAVTIKQLVFKRKGISTSSDFSGWYLYDDLGNRLTSRKSINSDTNLSTFANLKLVVPAGGMRTYWVHADMASTLTGNGQAQVELMSTNVQVNAEDKVGSFTLLSNNASFVASSVGSVTIAKAGTIPSPKIGQKGALIGQFKITAGTEDVLLSRLNLTVKGTVSGTGVTNLILKEADGTQVVGTSGIGSKDLANFVFQAPHKIKQGKNKNLYLYADVDGDSGDTITVYLNEDTDVVAVGGDFGYGLSVTRSAFDGDSCTSSAGDCSYSALEGGDVTFTFSGPPAENISIDGDDVTLFEFTLNAAGDTEVKDLDMIIVADDDDDSDPFDGGGDDASDSDGLIDTDAEGNVKDMKIQKWDEESEEWETLMGPLELDTTTVASETSAAGAGDALDGTRADAAQIIDFSDDFDILAGETFTLRLTADIDDDADANDIVGAILDISGFVAEDSKNNTVASTSIIPSSDLNGNNMTIVAASLTATVSGTPVTDTFVKGTKGIDALGINMKAGESENVRMTGLTLQGYIDADGDDTYNDDDGDATCDAAACDSALNRYLKDYVSAVYLYDADDLTKPLAGPKSVETDGDVIFDSMTFTIPKGTTKTVLVRVDLAKPTGISSDQIAFGVAAAADFSFEDEDGDSVTSGVPATLNTTPDSGVEVNVEDAGTLAFSEEGSPSAKLLVAGTKMQLLSKYKFTGTNEAFKVKNLEIHLDDDNSSVDVGDVTYARSIPKVHIKYLDSAGVEKTHSGSLSAGEVTFSNMTFHVPKDGSSYVSIYADVQTIQLGAQSGDQLSLVINQHASTNDFEAIGVGSGSTVTESGVTMPTNEANVKEHYVRKSVPTVATAAGLSSNFINGSNVLYGFTVAADAAGGLSWKQMRFKLAYNRNSDSSGALGNFKFFRGATDKTNSVSIVAFGDASVADDQDLEGSASNDGLPGAGDDAVAAFDGYVVVKTNDSATSEEVIPAGTTYTYYLKATAAGVDNSGDSLSVYIEDDTFALGANIALVANEFNWSRVMYVAPTSGSAETAATEVVYDLYGDTAAADGAVCANGTDDLPMSGTVTDCGKVAAVTQSLIYAIADDGTYQFVGYDINSDTVASDGFACTGVTGDLDVSGDVSTEDDCTTVSFANTNAEATKYYIGIDNGAEDFIGYDASDDTVAANGAVCGSATDDLAISGAAPADCEAVVKEASSTLNFVWSDQSNNSHSTRTADATNGYLVDALATGTHTLSY